MPRESGTGRVKEDGVPIRISISVDPSLRRLIRIAAAHADMSVGEWITDVIRREAERTVKR